MSSSYRIGITGDMYDKIMAVATAQEALENAPGVEVVRFEHGEDPVAPGEIDAFDALLAGGVRIGRESTIGLERLSLIVRFGAGYDRVDLDGCTEAGVIVATTPAGIRRAMSTAAMVHMLALATKYLFKRQCLYEGRWFDAAAAENIGIGLVARSAMSGLAISARISTGWPSLSRCGTWFTIPTSTNLPSVNSGSNVSILRHCSTRPISSSYSVCSPTRRDT